MDVKTQTCSTEEAANLRDKLLAVLDDVNARIRYDVKDLLISHFREHPGQLSAEYALHVISYGKPWFTLEDVCFVLDNSGLFTWQRYSNRGGKFYRLKEDTATTRKVISDAR